MYVASGVMMNVLQLMQSDAADNRIRGGLYTRTDEVCDQDCRSLLSFSVTGKMTAYLCQMKCVSGSEKAKACMHNRQVVMFAVHLW